MPAKNSLHAFDAALFAGRGKLCRADAANISTFHKMRMVETALFRGKSWFTPVHQSVKKGKRAKRRSYTRGENAKEMAPARKAVPQPSM